MYYLPHDQENVIPLVVETGGTCFSLSGENKWERFGSSRDESEIKRVIQYAIHTVQLYPAVLRLSKVNGGGASNGTDCNQNGNGDNSVLWTYSIDCNDEGSGDGGNTSFMPKMEVSKDPGNNIPDGYCRHVHKLKDGGEKKFGPSSSKLNGRFVNFDNTSPTVSEVYVYYLKEDTNQNNPLITKARDSGTSISHD